MKTFWQTAGGVSPVLAPLAIRLASTRSNSVPSEQSFSILKLLHNNLRNRLLPEWVDRLQYIYINERVLDWILAGNQVSDEDKEDLVSSKMLSSRQVKAIQIILRLYWHVKIYN
jgi:hypothetical protein